MKTALISLLSAASVLALASAAPAQKAPEAGYIFPAGGKAGTTVEVVLGGYDWTPDMEFFVQDKKVQLIPTAPPGPILIPPPPYWFGAKGRITALPLPREVPAKIVIPNDVPAGHVHWYAANANGCTSAGTFIVGTGPEVIQALPNGTAPQLLASLPMTVSGRLMKIEAIDRYRFVAPKDGPITCELLARRLGAKFLAILEVRDNKGNLVADVAGTNGLDPSLTFAAKAGTEYVVSLHDADFGGDRSFVYRLTITPGPRVVAAQPAAGRRGETREVEFVGMGVATGSPKLESVKRQVTFPAAPTASTFEYRLETPFGTAPPFSLLLSDLAEMVEFPHTKSGPARPAGPAGITSALDQLDTTDHYAFTWKKGQVWSLAVEAQRLGSPLDVALTVLGPEGKELARNDDLPDTTDAGLDFAVPADGVYQVVVSDTAGKSGTRAAIYRLVVRPPASDFALTLPLQRVSVPIGGKFDLAVKAVRHGDFKGPITLRVHGLPAGVSVPPSLIIPANVVDLIIPLQAAAGTIPAAGFVTVEGTASVGAAAVTRTAQARTLTALAPRSPEEFYLPYVMLAVTMKPLFKGHPVDQDTGRKVHRGSTFPAEVIVERLDGFQGEIVLQMAAQQSYQVHGITGGDVVVPPNVGRTIYPCFMPEWLETTRTSRMGMIAAAKVPDAKGKIRYVVNEITGFITMTLEGALLKVLVEDRDQVAPASQPFDVQVKVSRLTKLSEPVRLELILTENLAGKLKAEPITVPVGKETATFRVTPSAELTGVITFAIRGTAMQDGKYPAISETNVMVELRPSTKTPR